MSAPDLDVGPVLDETLTDLLNLVVLSKQVQWNLVGPGFLGLYALLDEVASMAREASDRVAERSMALGRHPDGRAQAVVMNNPVPSPDLGPVRDADAVAILTTALEILATRLFGRLAASACDRVTQDTLAGIAADLERFGWLLRAQGR